MHLTLLPVPGFLRSAASAQLPAGVPGRGAAALLLPAEGPRPLPPRLCASGRAGPGGPCGLPLAAGSPRSLRGGPGGRGSGSAFASSAGRAAEAPRAAAPPAALRHMARYGGGGSAPRGPGPGAAERQRLREALAEQLRRDVGRWARGEARRGGGEAVTAPVTVRVCSCRLLAEGTRCDVTLRAGGAELRAHRAVLLARAPRLFAPLGSPREALRLRGVGPAELRRFLR